MVKRAAATLFTAGLVAAQVARTPPMGWNSWNNFNCNVDSGILKQQAQAIHDTGLQAAGYEFVNSDDCWMLNQRDANGDLMPNPDKFPNISDTIAFIHSLGLKAGLYTARGHNTCAGFMAACGHEAQDARWYAAHLVDYLKDDDCSGCSDYLTDYGHMQQGIWASGRTILLTVEGDPDTKVVSKPAGGYGNAKRVGHDITSSWTSMVSLVDIGSGLWMYAHNATNATAGGWWNDLDMLEVGRGDFSGPGSLPLAQAHFSLWCLMKAPLLLGNDLTTIDPATLAVVGNKEAIALNQDPLGIQGRRTAVHTPANTTIVPSTGKDSVALATKCNPSAPTQQQTWKWVNVTTTVHNLLYVVACNASDAYQQWVFPGASGAPSALTNVANGMCADASGQSDPSQLQKCSGSDSQKWQLPAASNHLVNAASNNCLDVYNFYGPDVEIFGCKSPGDNDDNQRWTYNAATRQLVSLDKQTYNGYTCLAASTGPSGGLLQTTGPKGEAWCLQSNEGDEAGWAVEACDVSNHRQYFIPNLQGGAPADGYANYTLSSPGGTVGVNNREGTSGAWPHSRYIVNGGDAWTLDLDAASNGLGSVIVAANTMSLIDDDLVGGISAGGAFCLEANTMGLLETWTVPLSGGKWGVVLFNRSPADDAITLDWADLAAWGTPVPASTRFSVRDVWAAADRGVFSGQYRVASVPAHGVALLVLTPA